MTTVALLGAGIMGAGMGHNILAAGLELRVWNRTAARMLRPIPAPMIPVPSSATVGALMVVTVGRRR